MSGKQIFIIALMTLVTVVSWVIFEVIHARAEVKPTEQVQEVLEPIDPSFDQEAINML